MPRPRSPSSECRFGGLELTTTLRLALDATLISEAEQLGIDVRQSLEADLRRRIGAASSHPTHGGGPRAVRHSLNKWGGRIRVRQ